MTRKVAFWFICFLFIRSAINSQTIREKINFDNDWKFAFGDANNPVIDFNYGVATIFSKSGAAPGTPVEAKFYDSAWRILNLPHDWAVELPFVNSTSLM